MDISSKRIKLTEWNQGKGGQLFPKEGHTTKFDGPVPQQIIRSVWSVGEVMQVFKGLLKPGLLAKFPSGFPEENGYSNYVANCVGLEDARTGSDQDNPLIK